LAVGAHNIVATYSGDANNIGSGSGALPQVINKATSTTKISSSANPATSGLPVTLTAWVTAIGPTGTVNFTDGGISIVGCNAVALSGTGNTRTAACTTSSLASASHTIAVTYGGDGNNAGSTSTSLTQVVN